MKKNIVIIILVILLLGLSGYIVYDKAIDKYVDNKMENKDENKIENEVENNVNSDNTFSNEVTDLNKLNNYNINNIKNIEVDIPIKSYDGPEKKKITIDNKNEIEEILLNIDNTKEIGAVPEIGFESNVTITINYNEEPSTLVVIFGNGNVGIDTAVGTAQSEFIEYEIDNKNLSSELISKYEN